MPIPYFLRLRVGTRLIILASFGGALIAGLGALALYDMRNATARLEEAMADGARVAAVVDRARKAQADFVAQTREWKNFLLRGDSPADYRRFVAAYRSQDSLVRTGLADVRDTLQALGIPVDISDIIGRQPSVIRAYEEARQRFYHAGSTAAIRSADSAVRGIDRSLIVSMDRAVANIQIAARERSAIKYDAAHTDFEVSRNFFIVAVLGGIGMALVLSIVTIRSVIVPIILTTRAARQLGSGNLDTHVEVPEGDNEVSRLAIAFNNMADALRDAEKRRGQEEASIVARHAAEA